jgi:hypothetical protein
MRPGTSGTSAFGIPATTVGFCSSCPTPTRSDATLFFASVNYFTPNHLFPFLLQETTLSENVYRRGLIHRYRICVVKVPRGIRVNQKIVVSCYGLLSQVLSSNSTPLLTPPLGRESANLMRELKVFTSIRRANTFRVYGCLLPSSLCLSLCTSCIIVTLRSCQSVCLFVSTPCSRTSTLPIIF